MPKQKQITPHQPVLLHEVLAYLQPQKGESYLDMTAGYGGHARAIEEYTKAPQKAVLVDRDKLAVSHLHEISALKGAEVMHTDFFQAATLLKQQDKKFDVILADLGVSSPHLNIASRGFAFAQEGPLDMRMDQTQTLTAEELVNTAPEADLVDILRRYGEEPHAVRIARAIIAARPLRTTTQLAQTIESLPVMRQGRTHPATKTFQALRIAVNDELGLLEQALPLWLELLRPEGRIAVISFHSLEDRIVKQAFAERGGNRYDASLQILTKSPVQATQDEIVTNPRARSAKLRAAVKIKTKEE